MIPLHPNLADSGDDLENRVGLGFGDEICRLGIGRYVKIGTGDPLPSPICKKQFTPLGGRDFSQADFPALFPLTEPDTWIGPGVHNLVVTSLAGD